MPRLLFIKQGEAVWISHLDLMRLFQRAFKRAGLPLTHTQGYNPRPSVSIALPLSVGMESQCELLDFELEGACIDCNEIIEKLNRNLVKGIRIRRCYADGRKLRELALLRCTLNFEYDAGIPDSAVSSMDALFSRSALTVTKKGKNGPVEQDIIPMLRSIEIREAGERVLQIRALICCQNPSLNPSQLAAAVSRYCPELKPDHVTCCREDIYDINENVFR